MTAIFSSMKQAFSNRNLMVITLTQSLFMLTASLWWPYWSLYIQHLGASVTLLGVIFMSEMIFQLIFQLPGGYLTDRLGRKKVIVLGSICRGVSPVIYLLTGSWEWVVVGMFFTQASNMMIPAIDALIAESVTKENRGLGYGAFRMMTLLPQIFTAFLGGVIMDWVGIIPGVRLTIALTLAATWINVFIQVEVPHRHLRPHEGRQHTAPQPNRRPQEHGQGPEEHLVPHSRRRLQRLRLPPRQQLHGHLRD